MKFILKINKRRFIKPLLILIVAILSQSCSNKKEIKLSDAYSRINFPDILNIKNTPKQATDWSSFCFSDKGSWFGFALPDSTSKEINGCFTGPFMMTNGKWISKSIAKLYLFDQDQNQLKPERTETGFYPGKLVHKLSYQNFNTTLSLIYISSDMAMIHVSFKNKNKAISITPTWKGSIFKDEGKFTNSSKKGLSIQLKDSSRINYYFKNNTNLKLNTTDTVYSCQLPIIEMKEKELKNFTLILKWENKNKRISSNNALIKDALNNPEKHLELNNDRWNSYLKNILNTSAPWRKDKNYQNIAVKSLITLINNWRSPYGDLKHDGLFPSYAVNYFNGFWAWDSWKHAVALSIFEPELAKNQIRAMYDYQNKEGMIADCIYTDSTENNWLNTKPPLSGWAIWKVFEASKDTSFLLEMYPGLLKYHNWWYKNRDYDKNMLCEYGSTDGSLIAAKWESGMDNAIRFDQCKMLKIDDFNYVFNQESVDLNSYLYLEKLYISKISGIIKKTDNKILYNEQAQEIKKLVESKMFDIQSGYFYDIRTSSGEKIKVQGPEGWTPLFTKLSSSEKAKYVIQTMLDTNKFNTYIPFPTVSVNHPQFSEKYWRGPIWLDQVYFAIEGLRYYGLSEQANQFTYQIYDRLQGLKEDKPIRENYWPINGKGMRVNHFSWSAAHLLLLYHQ